MHAITRWSPNEKLTPNEKLSVKIANRLLATQYDFPDPRTQAVFARRTEDITASHAFLRHWRTGYTDWKEAWNDEWVSSEDMTALEDLVLIIRLLLDYQCVKAVLDEDFNYAPHNEAPVLTQSIQEGVEENSEENASSESQGVVSENDAAAILTQMRNSADQIKH